MTRAELCAPLPAQRGKVAPRAGKPAANTYTRELLRLRQAAANQIACGGVQRNIGIEPKPAGDTIGQGKAGVVPGQFIERRTDRSWRLKVGHSPTRSGIDGLRHGPGASGKGGNEEKKGAGRCKEAHETTPGDKICLGVTLGSLGRRALQLEREKV